jgi:hypothetical protein
MTNVNNETVTTAQSTEAPVQTPVKRGRGRPPGSKNKPKQAVAHTSTAPSEVSFEELGGKKQ